MKKNDSSIDMFIDLFHIDVVSGDIFWKIPRNNYSNSKPGPAGCINSHGYRKVKVDGVLYSVHRVVWAVAHGSWPENQIDHINGIRDDNRLENLREATVSQNRINSGIQINTKSGIKGVYRRGNKWCAQIGKKALGSFDDIELAEFVRQTAADKLFGDFVCHHRHSANRTAFPQDMIGGN